MLNQSKIIETLNNISIELKILTYIDKINENINNNSDITLNIKSLINNYKLNSLSSCYQEIKNGMLISKTTDNYYITCKLNDNVFVKELRDKYNINVDNIQIFHNAKVSNVMKIDGNNFNGIVKKNVPYLFSILSTGDFLVSEKTTPLELGSKHLIQSANQDHKLIIFGELMVFNNNTLNYNFESESYTQCNLNPNNMVKYENFIKDVFVLYGINKNGIIKNNGEFKSSFELSADKRKYIKDYLEKLCDTHESMYIRYLDNAQQCNDNKYKMMNIKDITKIGNSLCDVININKFKDHVINDIQKTTIYGNIKLLNLNKGYNKNELLMCFDQTKAFPGDAAYALTIGNYGKNKYCVETYPRRDVDLIRIMSYNVHNFHAICQNDVKKDPNFAINYIRKVNPDIVLLQEYVPYIKDINKIDDYKCKGTKNMDVDFSYVDKKMQDLGYVQSVKVNDFELGDKPFHNVFMGKAIYCKKGIVGVDTGIVGKVNGKNKDRGYLRIIYNIPESNINILIYTVHLTYGNSNLTQEEINELIRIINIEKNHYKIDYVVIMGDFNNNPHMSKNIFKNLKNNFKLLNDESKTAFNQNTSTGETIDLAWVSKSLLNDFTIYNESNEDKYKLVFKSDTSDHYPIVLDIKPNIINTKTNNKMFIMYKYLIDNIFTRNINSTCNTIFDDDNIGKLLSVGASGNFPIKRNYNGYDYIIKVFKYKKKYSSKNWPYSDPKSNIYNNRHPSDIELLIYQTVANPLVMNNTTQNIVIPYSKSYTCEFDQILNSKLCQNNNLVANLKNQLCNNDNNEYYDLFSYLFMEYGDKSLSQFYNGHEENKQLAIIFEILYTLFVMYDFVKFQHFDLHAGNIICVKDLNYDIKNNYYIYKFNNTDYYLPVMSHIPKIMDFDRSSIDGIINPMVEAKIGDRRYLAEDRDDPNRFLRSIVGSSVKSIQKWAIAQYNGNIMSTDDGEIVSDFLIGKAPNWPNAEKLLKTPIFDRFKTIPVGATIIDTFKYK
jgi:endonuclease/exonuclease/phosphatase family metal-dependent hydrolase